MWKYVAFVLLIVFCVPGSTAVDSGDVLTEITTGVAKNDSQNDTTTTTDIPENATTTDIPENATTTAVPETLPPVETTTVVNATTTEVSSNTTVVPVTTTTTTTAPGTTTPLPPPTVGKYAIHEPGEGNKTICLRAEMALRVDISDLNVHYNFPTNASTEGSECHVDNYTQILKLTDVQSEHVLTLIFVEKDKKHYVQNITYSHSPSVEVDTSGQYFVTSVGKSYLCNSETAFHVQNVTLTFSSVHLQAFGADSFAIAEECGADDKVGDIVPIAVGCALAALVVIVLIAYLVGRRRSRQRGYQSV